MYVSYAYFKGDYVSRTSASPAAIHRADPQRSLQLALAAARTAAENRGQNIVVLDLTEQTSLFDYFVIATGTSRRQLHAMSEEIDRVLEEELEDQRMGIEGYDESRWIVLDYGTVVVHLFDEETREYFSLETLWGDGKHLDFSRVLPPH
jgi:ribosome-associated protein